MLDIAINILGIVGGIVRMDIGLRHEQVGVKNTTCLLQFLGPKHGPLIYEESGLGIYYKLSSP